MDLRLGIFQPAYRKAGSPFFTFFVPRGEQLAVVPKSSSRLLDRTPVMQ